MTPSRYRYETRTARARRESRHALRTYIAVGAFLCLTVIGAPIGIVVIIVGLVQHSRSSSAISRAERDAALVAGRRAEDARINALRRL